jgi:hypothetical protein
MTVTSIAALFAHALMISVYVGGGLIAGSRTLIPGRIMCRDLVGTRFDLFLRHRGFFLQPHRFLRRRLEERAWCSEGET